MKAFGILLIVICCIGGLFTGGTGIILAVIAWIPAYIAKNKGRNFWTWYVYGVLLWIVALIHSIVLKTDRATIEKIKIENENLKKCPFCGELINKEAVICRYCSKEQYSAVQKSGNSDSAAVQQEKSTHTWKCEKCGNATNQVETNKCGNCNTPRYTMETISEAEKQTVKEYITQMMKFQTFEETMKLQKTYFDTNSLAYLKCIVPDAKNFSTLGEYQAALKEILTQKAEPVQTIAASTIQLQKLKELFENNLISETEYKAKKAKILGL